MLQSRRFVGGRPTIGIKYCKEGGVERYPGEFDGMKIELLPYGTLEYIALFSGEYGMAQPGFGKDR